MTLLYKKNRVFDMSLLSVTMVGLSSILLQIICLRQLLAVFSGNELIIGITLSVWLTAVGIGSYTGWRIRQRNAFALSFLAVALLSQPTLLLINSIRNILSLNPGRIRDMISLS